MQKTILAVFLLGILSFSACAESGSTYKRIDPETAKTMLENNPEAILLDVRTPEENRQIRIPGSLLLPDYDLSALAATRLPDKDALIIVYCRSGNRSRTAVQRLLQMGYRNVFDAGGINSWPYATESGN